MNTVRVVRVLQHVAVEGPGLIALALEREGIALEVTRVDRGEPVPADLGGAAGLVVLGGPMGVYEADRYPHLRDELRLIEAALRAGAPVLGVCLGSQLVAAALGARVYPGPEKEIGWFAVTPKPSAASDRLFAPLVASLADPAQPASFMAMHWHGDVFELPSGATSLAASAKTEHQAFRHGDRVYGLLFHLEKTAPDAQAMVGAFGEELASAGIPEATLLDDIEPRCARAAALGVPLFQRWAALLPGSDGGNA
jgi:GMP synthase (glutamine-hydrolysing)